MPNTYYDSALTGEQIEAALTAIDGVVTQENNGKVLAIENGKIVTKSVTEYTDVPELISKTITENGSYNPADDNADGYSSVIVNVQGGGGSSTLITKTITRNGTYSASSDNADGYSQVVVNVSGGGDAPTYFEGVDYPIQSLGNNGDLFIQYLASGLRSTGDAVNRINTGIPSTSVYGVEFIFSVVRGVAGYQIYLSGADDNFTFGASSNDYTGAFLRIRGGQIFNSGGFWGMGQLNTLKIENGVVTINDLQRGTYTPGALGSTENQNVCLFSPSNSSRTCDVIVYSLKLYGQNNDLLFDGTADSVSGTPCIYDSVSDTYLYNTGTGTITISAETIRQVLKKQNGSWVDWFKS